MIRRINKMEPNKFKKFQQELADIVVSSMTLAQKAEVKEGSEQALAEIAKMKEENKALASMVEEMKKSVGKPVSLIVPTGGTETFIYKGYDLRNQMQRFDIPNERKELHSKFLIDMIKKTALTEASAGGGGYTVPDQYDMDLQTLARLSSIALQECRIWNMTGDVLRIPAEGAAVTVDWASAEADPNNQSEPTFTEIALSTKRLGAYSIASNELLEDSAIDITGYLTEVFSEAQGQELDNQVFNGTTFTSDLHGGCGTTISGAASISALTFTHFSNAIAQLEEVRAVGAKFYFNKSVAHYVRTMIDASNRLIYQFPTAGNPGQIYGFPAVQVPKMTAAPTSGQQTFVFGNLYKGYALGKRRGMTMSVNPYILMKENQTQFVCNSRWDGAIALSGALVEFVIGS
jgi:HK97 family phage major capsid protein